MGTNNRLFMVSHLIRAQSTCKSVRIHLFYHMHACTLTLTLTHTTTHRVSLSLSVSVSLSLLLVKERCGKKWEYTIFLLVGKACNQIVRVTDCNDQLVYSLDLFYPRKNRCSHGLRTYVQWSCMDCDGENEKVRNIPVSRQRLWHSARVKGCNDQLASAL